VLPDAQDHARDPARPQQAQLMRQKRLAVDFDERLGELYGYRMEPRAKASRQDRDGQ
jgi:hypothetical protein